MRFTRSETGDTFSVEEVSKVLKLEMLNRRTLHLPKCAVAVLDDILLLLTWAIANMSASLGLTSQLWWREISPIRTAGRIIVIPILIT